MKKIEKQTNKQKHTCTMSLSESKIEATCVNYDWAELHESQHRSENVPWLEMCSGHELSTEMPLQGLCIQVTRPMYGLHPTSVFNRIRGVILLPGQFSPLKQFGRGQKDEA